jgi:hypothetical protein
MKRREFINRYRSSNRYSSSSAGQLERIRTRVA